MGDLSFNFDLKGARQLFKIRAIDIYRNNLLLFKIWSFIN